MKNAYDYKRFGDYFLLEKLASGGMAEIYLAHSRAVQGIGKFFAIKTILPKYANQEEFTEMFQDEARMAMNLSHNNIATIYKFGIHKKHLFLVMDFVEGRNLRQIAKRLMEKNKKLSLSYSLYIIKEVACGLDYAHRFRSHTGDIEQIIHRDISPQNIMISFQGEVKIVDFGIAKNFGVSDETERGVLKGKFSYMSPEQASGDELDHRTDIFSLGIVLWELVTGVRLFSGKNEREILRKVRNAEVPKVSDYNPNIPKPVEKIIERALSHDPGHRYQNGVTFQKDISYWLNSKYPGFSGLELSRLLKEVFCEEMESLKERCEKYIQDISNHPEETTGVWTGFETELDQYFPSDQDSISQNPPRKNEKFEIGDNTVTNVVEVETEKLKEEDPKENIGIESDIGKTLQEEEAPEAALKDPFELAKIRIEDQKQDPRSAELEVEDLRENKELKERKTSQEYELSLTQLSEDLEKNKIKSSQEKKSKSHLELDLGGSKEKKKEVSNLKKDNQIKVGVSRVRPLKKRSVLYSLFLNIVYVAVIGSAAVGSYYVFVYEFDVKAIDKLKEQSYQWLQKSHQKVAQTKYGKELLGFLEKYIGKAPLGGASPEAETISLSSTEKQEQKRMASIKKPEVFEMIFRSTPSGAWVYVDGEKKGSTPMKLSLFKSPFSLKIERPGFIPYISRNFSDFSKRTFSVNLKRVSILRLDVKPLQEVTIYINGQKMAPQVLPHNYEVPSAKSVKIKAINARGQQRTINVDTTVSKKPRYVVIQF